MSHYPFSPKRLDQFREYLVLEHAFLPHEIVQINNLWDEHSSLDAELEGNDEKEDITIRKSSVLPISPHSEHNWIFQRLTDLAHKCNQHSYHFDLMGFYEPLQLAEYQEGDFFDWHLDFGIGSTSTRKLSITVQLSDPTTYDGGRLQFRINDKTIDASDKPGTAIIFPSFIMHRVSPITRGKRRSLVGWVTGNHYR